MESKEIETKWIDTQTAADNYYKNFTECKTYFFNGDWGSGKTTFIREIFKNRKKKLVTINFWEVKDDRTAIKVGFSLIHPFYNLIIYTILLSAVVISILMTDLVNLGLTNWISEPWDKIVGLPILFIAVYQFFKPKSDYLYLWLFNMVDRKPSKNKVIIIDDFDRISKERQEDIYKLFNIIKDDYIIIFIGDYTKIAHSETSYLLKIVDNRLELPLQLMSQNIWEEYIKQLEDILEIDFPYELKKLIIKERKNLRDRDHFSNYINRYLISNEKYNHIHIDQQIWIIYLYIFHFDYYNILLTINSIELDEKLEDLKFAKLDFTKDKSVKYKIANVEYLSVRETILVKIKELQIENKEQYPAAFCDNRELYYINENPINLTEKEIVDILNTSHKLKIELLKGNKSDLYLYLLRNYQNLSDNIKDKLIKASLSLIKDGEKNSIINYIIHEKNKILQARSITDGKVKERNLISKWKPILTENNFDSSECFKFLRLYTGLNIYDIGKIYKDIDINNIIDKQRLPVESLLVYMSSNNLFYQNMWFKDEKIKVIVHALNIKSFFTFLQMTSIISESFEKKHHFILWESRYYSGNRANERSLVDNNEVIKEFKTQISDLNSKLGIQFEINNQGSEE